MIASVGGDLPCSLRGPTLGWPSATAMCSRSEWCYNELKGDSLSVLGDLLVPSGTFGFRNVIEGPSGSI